MGAVTALLAANEDPSIAGVVLDSPFASLKDLMVELVERWTEGSYVGVPRAATQEQDQGAAERGANFDTDDLEVECAAETSFCPALCPGASSVDKRCVFPKHHIPPLRLPIRD